MIHWTRCYWTFKPQARHLRATGRRFSWIEKLAAQAARLNGTPTQTPAAVPGEKKLVDPPQARRDAIEYTLAVSKQWFRWFR